jgi:hypothetical protein
MCVAFGNATQFGVYRKVVFFMISSFIRRQRSNVRNNCRSMGVFILIIAALTCNLFFLCSVQDCILVFVH